MEEKRELISTLDKISVFILGFFLVVFPLTFSSLTTDPFSLPKQLILGAAVLFLLIIFGAKVTIQGSVRVRRTPFDLPLILLTVAVLLSAFFSLNKIDSLMTFVPFLLSVLLYFAITNNIRTEKSIRFITLALVLGSLLTGVITILSYLKIYILPFDFVRTPSFTPFGSLFDQAIYLFISLSLAVYLFLPVIKRKRVENGLDILTGAATIITAAGFLVTVIEVLNFKQAVILPLDSGLQIGFAAISQDTGRIIQGLLFGSGVGNFLSDFTRFKQAAFNSNQTLWSISFFRSSSFLLELLATTGIAGVASFLFLVYRIFRTKPLFFPAVLAVVAGILLPFSVTSIAIFFITVAILAAVQGLSDKERFFDVDIHLVAFKQGIFALSEPSERHGKVSKALPAGVLALFLVFAAVIGYYYITLSLSDIKFQSSLVAANQNNGSRAYDDEVKAISYFSQRDGYQRIFSQLNLNLANSIASSIPKGSSPSAQTQQTIYTLIQQSINSARQATTIAPLTVSNWQNLSSVYRSLIGFGQNADTFSILAAQQAVVLDPNNPQEYINLGGIFYQLGQWDNAIQQFQVAANLKPDYSNAYYNLGHALEQKGDLKGALTAYQNVKTLVSGDKTNSDKITAEINALQAKINDQASGESQTAPTNQLNVSQPTVTLPAQNPPVKIPAPSTAPVPSPSASPSPSSTPGATPPPSPSANP